MKQLLSWKKFPLLILACGLLLTVTFAQSNAVKQARSGSDTLPTKHKKVRNLDEAMADLDRSEIELKQAFREINQEKMEKEMREAMKRMEIDMSAVEVDIARAMKDIDMEKINLDVQKAMAEIDSEKLKAEVSEAMAKVDMQKIKAEIQKAKSIDFKKMKAEMEAIQPHMKKAMKEAQVGIAQARKEITLYKNLVAALEKDGLLKQDENFTVEYKNGELTINGKKLSAEAAGRYKKYLGNKEDFTLQKDDDGLEINN